MTESQVEFWTKVAAQDSRASPNQNDLAQAALEEQAILALLKILKPKRILEVGCANGDLLKKIQRILPKSKLVGIDITPQFIERARYVKPKGIRFIAGNVLHLDFRPALFDCVISRRCLINLTSEEAQQKAVDEIKRVLKPRGTYIMLESGKQGYADLNKARHRLGLGDIKVAAHNLPLNVPILKLQGFTVTQHDEFSAYYYLTRLIYPALIAPEQPEYNQQIHRVALNAQLRLGGLTPNLSPVLLWTLKKND